MITGDAADSVVDRFAMHGQLAIAGVTLDTDIGIVYQDEGEADDKVGQFLLNAREKIWVRFNSRHFDAIVAYKGRFLVYDPFNQDPAQGVEMKTVNPLYPRLMPLMGWSRRK
jgi:hypothetical protein